MDLIIFSVLLYLGIGCVFLIMTARPYTESPVVWVVLWFPRILIIIFPISTYQCKLGFHSWQYYHESKHNWPSDAIGGKPIKRCRKCDKKKYILLKDYTNFFH